MFELTDFSDKSGAEKHRARYLQLRTKATARRKAVDPSRSPAAVAEPGQVLEREVVPAGWYWTVRMQVGQRLRILNLTGRASVSIQIWNALDPSERLNVGDTAKLQWTTRLTTGSLLFSDMGRMLAALVEDQAEGCHDLLTGASDELTNQRRYGRPGLRHSHGNFVLAAAKLGLSRRDIHPCVSFFAAVHTDAQGDLKGLKLSRPGGAVELRAEMPILLALSNCPHPLDPCPLYDPGEIELIVSEAVDVAADDPCRTASEEAERAFDNTRAWIAARRETL